MIKTGHTVYVQIGGSGENNASELYSSIRLNKASLD